jgi:hypothetical protein
VDEWPKLEKKFRPPTWSTGARRDWKTSAVAGCGWDRRGGVARVRAGGGNLELGGRKPARRRDFERAFLSDLDVYSGLADLQDRNLIVQGGLQVAAERAPARRTGPWISARAIGLWALFLLVVALAIREQPRNPWNLSLRPLGERREAADLLKAVSLGRLAAVERALRVYYDSTGQYAKRVEDLLDSGRSQPEAITDPYGRPYRYILRSEDGKFSPYGRNAQGNIDLDLSFERSLAPVSESRPLRTPSRPTSDPEFGSFQ